MPEKGLGAAHFANAHVLVTGAAGFLGRALCDALRAHDAMVTAVDNAVIPTGDHEGVHQVSAVDYSEINRLLGDIGAPTHIICAAGIASPYWYSRKPLETISVAVEGTRTMLKVARRTGARLLYLSSSEVYGNPDVVPTPEDYWGSVDILGKRACYDVSKMLGETLCSVYARQFGVEAVIARPFNVFGPGMSDQDYRMMPQLRRAKRDGKTMTLYGTGLHTRTFCYATDAVEGLLLVLAKGERGQAYNVGNDSPEITMRELCSRAGVPSVTVQYPPDYPDDEPKRRCPALGKLRALGYEPQVSLDEGLARFLR